MTTEEFLQQFGPMLGRIFMAVVGHQNEDGSVLSARGQQRVSAQAFSLINHFVAALLACNPRRGERLSRTLHWLLLNTKDTAELNRPFMNRLEALLMLNPAVEELTKLRQAPELLTRLLQGLTSRRGPEGFYNVDELSPSFASLWAIKLLNRAKAINNPLLQNMTLAEQMRQDLSRLLQDYSRNLSKDKDRALGIRLRRELFGDLLASEEEWLLDLVNSQQQNGNLWDMDKGLLRHMPIPSRNGSASFGINTIDIDVRRKWREAFVSTCYVIENLAPLRHRYPDIGPSLDDSMLQLCTYYFQDAPDSLYANFDREYDQLQIMCRFLAACQAYTNGQLQVYLFALLMDSVPKNTLYVAPDRIDVDGVENALRHWFYVDHEGEVEPLTRGFSGARVVRIQPRVSILAPSGGGESITISLPFQSAIVKYGPRSEIEAEVKNYLRLPVRIQHVFAALRVTYRDEAKDRDYAVIQDLVGYDSLEEHLLRRRMVISELPTTLSEFLQDFHNVKNRSTAWEHPWLARILYFEPLWRYVESAYSLFNQPQLQTHLNDNGAWKEAGIVESIRDREHDIRRALAQLYRHETQMNRFPATYMHGDLHTRNVMIRPLGNSETSPVKFMFIDLEKFMEAGDYACDIGELVVSLNALATSRECEMPIQKLIMATSQMIRRDYFQLAEDNKDTLFPARLALSEARARLRIAHGKSKEGMLRLREGKISEAVDIAVDVLALTDSTCRDLESAHERLQGA